MRFFITAVCMGVIGIVAGMLVIVDLIIKLMPLLAVAAVVLAGLRIWGRNRREDAAPRPSAATWYLNEAAAFARVAHLDGGSEGVPGPIRRHVPRDRCDDNVIDVEVIDAELIGGDEGRD
jgi:hypothetical protein